MNLMNNIGKQRTLNAKSARIVARRRFRLRVGVNV